MRAGRRVAEDVPRRFAYADPPYPGMAHRYYRDHPDYAGEVDHADLVARLVREFPDGWALSTSSRSLRDVLPLCPNDVWIGAWTKPAPPHASERPRSAWEPVVFAGGRRLVSPAATSNPSTTATRRLELGATRAEDPQATRLDWVHAAPMRRYPAAVTGTKPPAFCVWVFRSLGAQPGDELVDLFPGSGAVSRAWERFASLADEHDASARGA